LGRRVKKAVYAYVSGAWELEKEILFVYDGWNLIQEKKVSGTGDPLFDNFYVWGLDLSQSIQGAGGIGGLVCRVSGGEVRHYFYDGNGNVGQLVNPADGAVTARYEYEPFGNAVFVDGADAEGNAIRFSTKYWDEETDLVYYGYRYYSLGLERWTARDPFQEQGGLNLLVFARNNPLTFVDPLGNDYSSYTGSSPEDLDFGGGGSWQSPRKPYMMDPPSPVLPYINAGTQVVAGAVLMVLPDGTITKAGGILLITDGVDKLQALIRGDRTEFEKYLDRFDLSEGEKQAILCLKEFSIVTIEVSVVFTKGASPKSGLNSSNRFMGVERASDDLLGAIGSRRTVKYAKPGSEDMRYLDYIGAEANAGGANVDHILLRPNPSKAAVLEEFLHGTQQQLGIIERLGIQGAETHVKDFMIRHQRMLGLSAEDVKILQQLKDAGL